MASGLATLSQSKLETVMPGIIEQRPRDAFEMGALLIAYALYNRGNGEPLRMPHLNQPEASNFADHFAWRSYGLVQDLRENLERIYAERFEDVPLMLGVSEQNEISYFIREAALRAAVYIEPDAPLGIMLSFPTGRADTELHVLTNYETVSMFTRVWPLPVEAYVS